MSDCETLVINNTGVETLTINEDTTTLVLSAPAQEVLNISEVTASLAIAVVDASSLVITEVDLVDLVINDCGVGGAPTVVDYAEIAAREKGKPFILYAGDYIGQEPATSDPAWRIRRTDIRVLPLVFEYADGDANFDNVWDDREILTYSPL